MWIFTLTFGWILFILLNVILYTRYYFTSQLSLGSFAQVLYTLQNPMEGSEGAWKDAVIGFFIRQWPALLAGTIVFAGLLWLYIIRKKGKLDKVCLGSKGLFISLKAIKTTSLILLAVLLALDCVEGHRLYASFGIDEYFQSLGKTSDLYEKYYADPRSTEITFPEKKKNLIYILCESMEASYTGPEYDGGYKKSLIPELSALAKENTDFSNEPDKLNGAYTPGNTGWTIAGIVAQSMGIPLNIGNGEFNRNFEGESQFLPHVIGLGDILKNNGYSNYFMCGSESEFAGRKNYYEQHGDYEVYDYNTAKQEGFIPEDYRVWWGMEDEKLFTYAKEKLADISQKDEPFNFTMLTVDTHFKDGYKCPDCPDEFDTQYENVIRCSDHKVAEFVKWVQSQDFYKDTTIVIAGDHQSMDGSVAESVPSDYVRTTFFTVINGPEYTLNTVREYSTMDIYPTIIESLGAEIKGGRLGLGTSLYSRTPTLIEELGFETLNTQMNQKSEFYDSVILNGDESKLPAPDDQEGDNTEEEGDYDQSDAPAAITAQQYEENRENFTDPGYVWTPPVQEPVYDPGYYEPAPSVPVDPGTDTGGDQPSTGGGTETPPSGGDQDPTPPSTGGDTGGGSTETPPSSGGDDTGSSGGTETPPSTGGDNSSSSGSSESSQTPAAALSRTAE